MMMRGKIIGIALYTKSAKLTPLVITPLFISHHMYINGNIAAAHMDPRETMRVATTIITNIPRHISAIL